MFGIFILGDVAQRVFFRSDDSVRLVSVGGYSTRGISHQVVALFRMVLDVSLLNAVLAPGMYAASLAVIFPVEGISVAVCLFCHQMSLVHDACGLSECVSDGRHVSVPVIAVGHQCLCSLVCLKGQLSDEAASFCFYTDAPSCRICHFRRLSIAEVYCGTQSVRVHRLCHAETLSVTFAHIKHIGHPCVMVVCLVAFFCMLQGDSFFTEVEFFAFSYSRKCHGPSVFHAKCHCIVFGQLLYGTVIDTMHTVPQPSRIVGVRVP